MPATIQCHRFRAPFDGPPLLAVCVWGEEGAMIPQVDWEKYLTPEQLDEIQWHLENPHGPSGTFTLN